MSNDLKYYFLLYKNEICGGKNQTIDDIINKLKIVSFKRQVLIECVNIFYYNHPNFKEEMDTKTHLICFKNGVYDLEKNEFRDGRIDDCITLSTRQEYTPFNKQDPGV